jgi:hypothetical protein
LHEPEDGPGEFIFEAARRCVADSPIVFVPLVFFLLPEKYEYNSVQFFTPIAVGFCQLEGSC